MFDVFHRAPGLLVVRCWMLVVLTQLYAHTSHPCLVSPTLDKASHTNYQEQPSKSRHYPRISQRISLKPRLEYRLGRIARTVMDLYRRPLRISISVFLRTLCVAARSCAVPDLMPGVCGAADLVTVRDPRVIRETTVAVATFLNRRTLDDTARRGPFGTRPSPRHVAQAKENHRQPRHEEKQ